MGDEVPTKPVPPPSERARGKADQIIVALLGLVVFVTIVGTLGNLWDRGVKVDVALVTALLGALATYAIAGKFKDK